MAVRKGTWTKREIDFLKKNAKSMTTYELAYELNRSSATISSILIKNKATPILSKGFAHKYELVDHLLCRGVSLQDINAIFFRKKDYKTLEELDMLIGKNRFPKKRYGILDAINFLSGGVFA